MTPKITIGFPVYNVAPFVERSLLSALEQNFDLPYEVLVVDDCGTDNSMDLIRKIAQTHPKGDCIRIVAHPQNRGLGEASNTAIENAKGEWLLFLDSDDRLTPDCLSLLYENAEKENADFVIGNTTMINEQTGETRNYGAFTNQVIRKESAAAQMLFSGIDAPGYERWNKLYRVSFLRENNIRCIHRIMEDMFFSFNTYLLSNCIITVNTPTYIYNNTPRNSIMSDNLRSALPQAAIDVYLSLINNMQSQIKDRYSNKEYAYDLYFYFVSSICDAYARSEHTPEVTKCLADGTKGFAAIVPEVHAIRNRDARLFYVAVNRKDASIIDYYHWRIKAHKLFWRIVKWILSKI